MSFTNSLEYPFDSTNILKHKKAIKKWLLDNNAFQEVKIAMLSGSTIGYIKDILELFLLKQGIKPVFWEGNYGRYIEDTLFENNTLFEFSPDIVYIHTSNKNIDNYLNIANEYEKFEKIWEKIKEIPNCKIIQNNFEMLSYRLLGNRDVYDTRGKLSFINELNQKLYEYARANTSFFINDINYLSAYYGIENWYNPQHYYLYKYALDISKIPVLSFNISNIIKSLYGKNKKTIILDLDNTIWGGIIGDIGAKNIEIGMDSAQGEAFLDFQKYLKELSELGIVLNIASKNNEEIALEGLKNEKNVLKAKDFIVKKINWEPKSKNVQSILKEINLLSESAVFIDDNPIERDEVRSNIEKISTINTSEILDFIKYINNSGFFEFTNISSEDKERNKYYQANLNRNLEIGKFKTYDEYLSSLHMTAKISKINETNKERVSQLFGKTNQFNLTQKKYSPEQLSVMSTNKDYISIVSELDDKFGKNGIVSAIVARKSQDNVEIENWTMSCRVFKRGLEKALFSYFVQKCKEQNIKKIIGKYIRTEKNSYVSNLFPDLNFNLISKTDKEELYEFNTNTSIEQNTIKIIKEEA